MDQERLHGRSTERTDVTRTWDVVVIGAGPAGAIAARELAGKGLSILLVDEKPLGREKVCGGCLNHRTINLLSGLGLSGILNRCGGRKVSSLSLQTGRGFLELSLPEGYAVSRRDFDRELVSAAMEAGAVFLPNTSAVVRSRVECGIRTVILGTPQQSSEITAKVVISAEGLRRSSLREFPAFTTQISRKSRIGGGAAIPETSSDYPMGKITMAITRSGYLGVVRTSPEIVQMAAAFDPVAVRNADSLAMLAAETLAGVNLPVPAAMDDAPWLGTPMLTSRPGVVAGERIFLIGDSAGYVEPFTGEGVANAIEGAIGVSPLVVEGVRRWEAHLEKSWIAQYRKTLGRRQSVCRVLTSLLRSPACVSAMISGCRLFPSIPQYLVNLVNSPDQRVSHILVEQT